jgi:hypothetical protein
VICPNKAVLELLISLSLGRIERISGMTYPVCSCSGSGKVLVLPLQGDTRWLAFRRLLPLGGAASEYDALIMIMDYLIRLAGGRNTHGYQPLTLIKLTIAR